VGADASITPLVFAGFCSLRALSSKFNDDPEKASRPFDRLRDGFIMGEGAGTLILESAAHAKKRKARVYAEIAGYAATSEAYHMVIPREDGLEVALTMRLALADAGVTPAQVDYINAHGTATTFNDAAEGKAIAELFGKVPVSSTKSMIGHSLGAASAIEAVICLAALKAQFLPPNINFRNPDPDLDLNIVANTARDAQIDIVLSNSFGFGGTNASILIQKVAA